MFLPYFFPVACYFHPACAPLGPALCCCALTITRISCLPPSRLAGHSQPRVLLHVIVNPFHSGLPSPGTWSGISIPSLAADLAINSSTEWARAALMENDPSKTIITSFPLAQWAEPIQAARGGSARPDVKERARIKELGVGWGQLTV